MSNYKRLYIPGHQYFLTWVTAQRKSILIKNIDILRNAFKKAKKRKPFEINAIVVLPDHIHCLMSLPEGESDYSKRVKLIKYYFSTNIENSEFVWQKRFWEHCIRDEKDWRNHMDYIHFNPVKHGLVSRVVDWPYSSFHQNVRRGLYSKDWGALNASHIIDWDFE